MSTEDTGETPVDPSGLIGKYVQIHGTSRAEMNGIVALASSYDTEKSRYNLTTYSSLFPPTTQVFRLKPENVQPAGAMKAKMAEMKHKAADGMKDNLGTEQIKAASAMQAKFDGILRRHGWTTEHFLILLFALHLGLWYFRGIARTGVFMFLWYIPFITSFKDLLDGVDVKTIPGRFGMNVRTKVLASVPGAEKISDRMITTAYACVAVLGAKYIYTYPAGAAVGAAAAAAGGGALAQSEVDRIYGMGFDDGAAGKPFGTALDDPSRNSASGTDGDYAPPAPAPVAGFQNLMGFQSVMSLGLLGKFGMDIGQGPGGWNPAHFQGNLQGQGAAKLLMPAFSLYRLYSAFMGK